MKGLGAFPDLILWKSHFLYLLKCIFYWREFSGSGFEDAAVHMLSAADSSPCVPSIVLPSLRRPHLAWMRGFLLPAHRPQPPATLVSKVPFPEGPWLSAVFIFRSRSTPVRFMQQLRRSLTPAAPVGGCAPVCSCDVRLDEHREVSRETGTSGFSASVWWFYRGCTCACRFSWDMQKHRSYRVVYYTFSFEMELVQALSLSHHLKTTLSKHAALNTK